MGPTSIVAVCGVVPVAAIVPADTYWHYSGTRHYCSTVEPKCFCLTGLLNSGSTLVPDIVGISFVVYSFLRDIPRSWDFSSGDACAIFSQRHLLDEV